jgi:pyridinium-3,5-biscarboxylic acid mononucleotide sulfurtransferase
VSETIDPRTHPGARPTPDASINADRVTRGRSLESVPAPEVIAEAVLRLDRWFGGCPGAAVAFSGGVDSALVAFWARRCLGRDRATAWTADSPSLKRQDLASAREFCLQHDIVMRELRTTELDNPNYASNPINRCYYCKNTLYETLGQTLADSSSDAWICSGANLDDQGDYRPGMQAAAESEVRHPLLECGIGKEIIRALAKEHGLAVWDKPASPCLSSRIPYGEPVTPEKLAQIESAEIWLQQNGFPIGRVRHFGTRAVIEVPPDRLEELAARLPELHAVCNRLGFDSVAIDPEGFKSGKLNRAISRDRQSTSS